MKEVYERPVITVEEFTVNRAIAACEERDVTFDCMIGTATDTTNVITSDSSCSRIAGTTTAVKASAVGSFSNSNYSGGTWSHSGNTCNYTAPNGAIGLIYFCNKCGTRDFALNSSGVLQHNTDHRAGAHVQIAPLYGSSTSDVNVGS